MHAQIRSLNTHIHPHMWANLMRMLKVFPFNSAVSGGASLSLSQADCSLCNCCLCVCDCEQRRNRKKLTIKDITLNQTCLYNYGQESEECCDLYWAWHNVHGPIWLLDLPPCVEEGSLVGFIILMMWYSLINTQFLQTDSAYYTFLKPTRWSLLSTRVSEVYHIQPVECCTLLHPEQREAMSLI